MALQTFLLLDHFSKGNGLGVVTLIHIKSASKIYYIQTRELPGVALVNILNRWIFTGKGNTHLKWNIEVAHVEEKIFEWDTIFFKIAF